MEAFHKHIQKLEGLCVMPWEVNGEDCGLQLTLCGNRTIEHNAYISPNFGIFGEFCSGPRDASDDKVIKNLRSTTHRHTHLRISPFCVLGYANDPTYGHYVRDGKQLARPNCLLMQVDDADFNRGDDGPNFNMQAIGDIISTVDKPVTLLCDYRWAASDESCDCDGCGRNVGGGFTCFSRGLCPNPRPSQRVSGNHATGRKRVPVCDKCRKRKSNQKIKSKAIKDET